MRLETIITKLSAIGVCSKPIPPPGSKHQVWLKIDTREARGSTLAGLKHGL